MVGVSAAAWLPFVVADRHTLSAGRPAVDTDASSVLHLLGLPLGQGPWWVRPLQLSVAVVLGVIAVRMGRWTAAPLVAITTRIVLDPAVLTYYVSGLLVAALAWDLLGSEQQFPVTVVAAFVAFDVVDPAIGSPTVRAVVRLVACVALIGWVLRPRRDRASSTEPVVVPS